MADDAAPNTTFQPDKGFSSLLASAGVLSPKEYEKKAQTIETEHKAARQPYIDQSNALMKQYETLSEQMSRIERPKEPKLEKIPDVPEGKYKDPMQALGSLASVIAIFGSLRTRAPMTAALNSAAAAMKGFHQGDQERVKLEQEKWKDEMAKGLRQNQEEMQKYTSALQSANFDIAKAQPAFRAIAAANEHNTFLAAIEDGDYRTQNQILTSMMKAGTEGAKLLATHQEHVDREKDRVQARGIAAQQHADAQKTIVTGPDGKPYTIDKRTLPALPQDTVGATKFGAKNAIAMGGEAAYEKLKTLPPEQDRELRIQAWNYIDKKVLPYRKGSGGGADRNDLVMAMAGKISDELGIPPQELAGKSEQFKSDSTSLANLTKKSDVIEGQLSSFHNNLQTWDQLAKGQGLTIGSAESKRIADKLGKISFTGIKTVDELKLKIQQEFDDPAAVALVTAASAAAFDYARIMSSQGQSAGQITDSARHEAQVLVSKGYDDKARAGLMAALDSDTQGQVKGLVDQREKVYDRLTGRDSKTKRPTGGAIAPVNAKGWTLHEDAQGNKAYVGPNNEIEEVR